LSDLPFRLCAIDLDDTLLDASHSISEHSAKIIKALVQKGVLIVLASGRMHAATLRYVNQLALTTPVISYNGAMVKNAGTGEIWLEDHIDADIAVEIRAYAHDNGLQLNYYLHDILYSAAETPWLKLYRDRTGAPIKILVDFEAKLSGTEPTKLVIVDAPEKVATLFPTLQTRFGSRAYVTRSNAEYLEFMPINASKGKALALVAEKYKLSAAQVVAFGDSWNDIPMLQWAGLGIAVANAKPEVREAAKRIVGSNTEDGVALALADIFGLTP